MRGTGTICGWLGSVEGFLRVVISESALGVNLSALDSSGRSQSSLRPQRGMNLFER